MNWIKKHRFAFFGGIIFLLLFAFVSVPIPYYIESPGPIENLKPFVSVKGKEDKFKGSFNITTVSQMKATGLTYLVSQFLPFSETISEKDMLGGATSEEYQLMNEYYMKTAQNAAKFEALKLAHQPYKAVFKGVYVMNVDEKSKFINDIQVGDTLQKINGKSFKNSFDLINYVQGLTIGKDATIEFLHNGKKKTATQPLIKLESTKKAGIGISLVDNTEIESDISITYDAYGITGPSGGLMLTLETYTTLTGKDIRHGQIIAGTGTMDFEGNVGRIGGIDKKIASASKKGATIFFAPDDTLTKEMKKYNPGIESNYKEALAAAKQLKTKMKIVPVKTAEDALKYLEQMK